MEKQFSKLAKISENKDCDENLKDFISKLLSTSEATIEDGSRGKIGKIIQKLIENNQVINSFKNHFISVFICTYLKCSFKCTLFQDQIFIFCGNFSVLLFILYQQQQHLCSWIPISKVCKKIWPISKMKTWNFKWFFKIRCFAMNCLCMLDVFGLDCNIVDSDSASITCLEKSHQVYHWSVLLSRDSRTLETKISRRVLCCLTDKP